MSDRECPASRLFLSLTVRGGGPVSHFSIVKADREISV